nr:MAG TPA: hypothetical protein [Caudoviricetes sp.]
MFSSMFIGLVMRFVLLLCYSLLVVSMGIERFAKSFFHSAETIENIIEFLIRIIVTRCVISCSFLRGNESTSFNQPVVSPPFDVNHLPVCAREEGCSAIHRNLVRTNICVRIYNSSFQICLTRYRLGLGRIGIALDRLPHIILPVLIRVLRHIGSFLIRSGILLHKSRSPFFFLNYISMYITI